MFDFVCGDEACGACTRLREFPEGRHQACVLRVRCSFRLTLARGVTRTRLARDTEIALVS